MKEKIQKFRDYLDYIEEHYDNVQKAWKLVNEKCKGQCFPFMYDDHLWFSLDAMIKKHDMSKLSEEEFTQYRQFFYPCVGEVKNKELLNKGWEHHKKNNAHHWETWTNGERGKIQELNLVENICDWIAMSFKFGDTAKDYYEENKDDIKLPRWAEEYMYEIFECVYGK